MAIPGLPDGEYSLKLGKSFRSYRSTGQPFQEAETFHSLRYDFKPASIDPTQVATLAFEPMNKMTVIAPTQGDEGRQTVFKGSNKPNERECVLIFDHNTGELTLERLTHSIQVKKTREEKRSSARPSTPSLNDLYGAVGQSPPSSSTARGSKYGKGQNGNASNAGTSSNQGFNGRLSSHAPSSSATFRTHSPQPTSNSSSALISDHQHANNHHPPNDITMSDSSSSDSSSSDDDDDDDDDEEAARKLETSVNGTNGFSNGHVNGNASPASNKSDDSSNDDSSSSSSSDSDDDGDMNDSKPSPVASSNGHSNGSLSMPNLTASFSMPSFSQLGNKSATVSHDLRLSSESDSD